MAKITQAPFGQVNDKPVSLFTLTNDNGMAVKITNYGGIVTAILVPDRDGNFANVVAGFESIDDYVKDGAFLGALVGPYANRIANGRFTIGDTVYELEQNSGTNNLHSASAGINKKCWQVVTDSNDTVATLTLSLDCADGEGGFPGTRHIEAVYALNNDNELLLTMTVNSTAKSPLSLTSHSYFNLAGSGDVLAHKVMINAGRFTPVGPEFVPTGELQEVSGTPFDFRKLKPVGQDIGADDAQIRAGSGYDHNFVLDTFPADEDEPAAQVVDETSGRVMTVWTNTPGIQFYSANGLSGASGDTATFTDDGALCLEPQAFPDTPNQPSFPLGWVEPGEAHVTRIKYGFSTQ